MKSLVEYKDLLYELALRDLKMRYRKPFLGFFWMLIMPFCTALVYKILFSDFLRITSGPYPFFLYLMTALLPWNYFASSVQASARSVLDSRNIINQIAFPKYLLPVSTVFANLLNFIPALFVLLFLFIIFNIKISGLIIFLPFVILVHTCMIVGFSLLFSTLQVFYRDIEYILQILLMFLFFLTPGVYLLDELTGRVSPCLMQLYMLNPFVGILTMYRVVFIKGYLCNSPAEASMLNVVVIPVLFSLAMLFTGYCVFKKHQDRFSDYLHV